MKRTIHSWKKLSLIEEEITLPNKLSVTHTTLHHPGAVIILPILENGEILLLNQYRPSIKEWITELPAGTLEPHELPIMAAMRELEEETGYSAQTLIPLGQLLPAAGFCDEIQHMFLGRELTKTNALECDEDEVIEVLSYSVDSVEKMVINGEITDSKTLACLYKAKLIGLI